jgi:hypothetical protein
LLFLATRDPEYLGLEKNFNEISKYVDALAKDARAFRDNIAGKNTCLIQAKTHTIK